MLAPWWGGGGELKHPVTLLHTPTHILKGTKFQYMPQKYGEKFKGSTFQIFVIIKWDWN